MKAAVIGAGMMGSAVAWDLARSDDIDELTVADLREDRLNLIREKASRRVKTERIDVLDARALKRFLEGCDVAVSALPHGTVHPVDVIAVNVGAKLVNIAFEDEQMALRERAKKSGAVLIPGCGVAPGLSNILVAEGARIMDSAVEGHIFVGGLPQKPLPPLSYRLVFSVKGLVREYLTARIIRRGKVLSVKPFEDIQRVRFPKPVGVVEAFFTDGLGSSIYTLSHLRELDERTLRWPGHAEKIKFLIDAGFFSNEVVETESGRIAPVDLSSAVLQKLLTRGDPRDLTVMRVEVLGSREGRKAKVVFDLVDFYDEKSGLTSMGRTTGFTAAVVARMVGRHEIQEKGVLPPETALDRRQVKQLLSELAGKGVVVKRRIVHL